MIEPIDLRIEGDKVIIPEVEMSSQGIYSQGLDAFNENGISEEIQKGLDNNKN